MSLKQVFTEKGCAHLKKNEVISQRYGKQIGRVPLSAQDSSTENPRIALCPRQTRIVGHATQMKQPLKFGNEG